MYQPVIIVGAPRSGTNMLRDMLVELVDVETWPCDEINYIWRHGNVRYPSDEFSVGMAVPAVSAYIQKQFDKLADASNADVLIEKTCANSLRVGFVDQVIPNAKYIFIVRDGLDVVGSALERWQASLDVPYLLKKARYVPPTDLPYYATRYMMNHLYRLISRENHLAFWGPAMNDMDKLLEKYTLTEVCALQWKWCVDNAERDFASIPSQNVIRVSYEEFVQSPVSEFERMAEFIGKDTPDSVKEYLRNNVHPSSIGKGRAALGKEQVESLRPLISDSLEHYGYE
ncbi:MAG: sulfotransferase [Pseudomonadota bacterium]